VRRGWGEKGGGREERSLSRIIRHLLRSFAASSLYAISLAAPMSASCVTTNPRSPLSLSLPLSFFLLLFFLFLFLFLFFVFVCLFVCFFFFKKEKTTDAYLHATLVELLNVLSGFIRTSLSLSLSLSRSLAKCLVRSENDAGRFLA